LKHFAVVIKRITAFVVERLFLVLQGVGHRLIDIALGCPKDWIFAARCMLGDPGRSSGTRELKFLKALSIHKLNLSRSFSYESQIIDPTAY